MVEMTIILSSGERHVFTAKRRPRYWKSWVMQQLPYGTRFTGCRFEIKSN